MSRRSEAPIDPHFDPEIERTFRASRRVQRETTEAPTFQVIVEEDTLSNASYETSNSSMAEEEERQPEPLFRDFGAPNRFERRGGILLPTTTTNFTIHPSYTAMVQREPFSGLSHEDPIAHLERFVETCELITTNQVPQDYIRMHLFRASLMGKAKAWLNNLPANSLRSWEEVTKAFFNKFISESKSAEMRREISHFQQEEDEPLYEAWDRFQSLVRGCPHHCYPQTLLMKFFYDGLEPRSRANLDAGCGGQLAKVPQDRVEETIEEVVRNYSWGGVRRKAQPRQGGKLEMDENTKLQA